MATSSTISMDVEIENFSKLVASVIVKFAKNMDDDRVNQNLNPDSKFMIKLKEIEAKLDKTPKGEGINVLFELIPLFSPQTIPKSPDNPLLERKDSHSGRESQDGIVYIFKMLDVDKIIQDVKEKYQ